MATTPRKTFPELQALSAPVVDSDVLAVYRSPGPAKRTTASVLATYTGSIATNFVASGTSAVARTSQAKMRDTLHVKDFGVVANGSTNDTAAYQAAITAAAAQGKDLDHGEGTILVHSEISGTALSGNRLFGKATIKGANSTDFQYLFDFSNTTGVTLDGLTYDANKANRGSATNRLSCFKMNTTILPRLLNVTCKNTLGIMVGMTPSPSVAISASGGVLGLYADGLSFIDLGTDANTKPSDGLFIRGDHCIVIGTYGENVTDHIVVLEGSNYGQIRGTTGKNCTSFVAMSNDTSSDVVGNIIDGVTGTCNYFGSFGAIVGIYTFGAGWIRGCIVTNVTARAASGAGGGGPAILVSGNVEGEISNTNVHPGASSGVMTQAILINITAGGAGVRVSNCNLEVDGAANIVRIQNASNGIRFENNYFREGAYGIFADGTSSFTEEGNRFFSQTTGKIGLGGSATYYGSTWQAWTPVYSSDIGNAAATFTGTPTTTLARINRVGDTVSIALNFSSTLLAVSPSYLAFTVPSWALPTTSSNYGSATVLNDVTYAAGMVRTINGTELRVYRANFVGFSANAAVAGFVTFSYEVA
jgi:hypothetical protein